MSLSRLLCWLLVGGLSTVATGQRCGLSDTIALGTFGNTTVPIDISGYLNNNLASAGQGVCNVRFYFSHSYVYDFTATLTSPAGQSVTLVGPVNNQTRPPTSLARWFVDFVPCASPAQPDFPAPAAWNNDGTYNWPAFGTFDGSYYPADGCLEDFDAGTVNGRWTVTFNTDRPQQQGQGIFLLIDFCDDAHAEGPCCLADAGTVQPIPGLEFCEESPFLPLPLAPRYDRPRPDAAEYGYTFLLARDGVIVGNQDSPDLGNQPAGSYEICGLSYRNGELGQLDLSTSPSFDDLRTDLASPTPSLCADLTPVCQTVILYPIPDTNFITRTICRGGSVFVGGTNYVTSGVRTINLTGRAGCDSVIVFDLRVVDELRETVDVEACSGQPYAQGGNVYTAPGTYRDTFPSSQGCDSIVTLNLTFAAPIVTDVQTAICAGESYLLGGQAYDATGNYSRVLTSRRGCDSTVNLDLIVLDPEITFEPVGNGFTCADGTIVLDATNSRFEFLNRGVWTDREGNDLSFQRSFPVTVGGWYYYELTNETRGVGCTVDDSLFVDDFRLDVRADLELTRANCNGASEAECAVISCRNPSLGIRARPTSEARNYSFDWTATAGGRIVGPANGAEIVVNEPGRYEVTITDPLSLCSLDTFYLIGADTITPRTDFSGLELLTCAVDEVRLVADTQQVNQDRLRYTWRGVCLDQPVGGPILTTNCPGTYELTVEDEGNDCVRRRTFTVERDVSVPVIDLAPVAGPISCFNPTRTLDATRSSSTNGVEFAWRPSSGADTLSTRPFYPAGEAGTYVLQTLDSLSRCISIATITVAADTLRPVADSGPDTLLLNCYTPDHVLGERMTSVGANIRYDWRELNDPNVRLSDLRDLFTADPGIFQLTVTDIDNGCTNVDVTQVVAARDTPFIRLQPPLDFECFIDSVQLNGSATNLTYDNVQNWRGPCLPPDTDTSITYAFCPGEYIYTVINRESGCRDQDTLNVLLGNNSVVAVLPDSAFLDCDTGETRLDRSRGTDAPVVEWFFNGQPIELVGMRPRVRIPGVYTLVLGNFNASCRDTASVVVTAPCPALSIIVPPDSLTCTRPLVTLDASTSAPAAGPNVVTEWLVPAGATTQPGATERELTVFRPGAYGFVVRNLISGDVDTSYVTVTENVLQPVANAGERDTLNCLTPLVMLRGEGSSAGPLFDYLWTTTAGDTIAATRDITVVAGGFYLLRVTQRETGCSSVDNVRVLADFGVPDLSFSTPRIPCDTFDFGLRVFPDRPGDYAYDWRGPHVIADADSATVRISDAGTYTLDLTNLANGCSVSETLLTERLPCPPFPQLRDTSLSCNSDTIVLAATFRDPCQGCTYTWERNGNNLLGENDTTLAVVEEGTYRIVAINRFGLIGFAESVVLDNRVVPVANAGPDRVLTCAVTSVVVGGRTRELGFDFGYRWYGPDGNVIPGETTDSLRVNTGGLYQLESLNLASDCQVRDTVFVNTDTALPVADAGFEQLLDCNNKVRVLDGINSSLGSRYTYRWTGGPSTACLNGETSLNPQVRCGGLYTLTVNDTINGCSSTADVFVETDDALPVVIPLPDTTLDCSADTLRLVGRDITRPDIRFGWQEVRPEGNVPLASTNGVLDVLAEGTYYFSITDTLNGCFNDFTVRVEADLSVPSLRASAPDTFFCALDSLLVTGMAQLDGGRTPDYEWTSRTGFFVDNAEEPVATIFQPDVYYITARDPTNFCTSTDSVIVFRDTEAPVVEAGAMLDLTCADRQVQLSGSAVTVSGQAAYAWSTMEGNILNGNLGQTPLVNASGRYLLTVTDPVSGCTGADIARVGEDTIRPLAEVLTPVGRELNCYFETLTARARLAASGQQVPTSYRWVPPANYPADQSLERDSLVIARAGLFRLVARRDDNGCRDTVPIVITQNFVPPAALIASPDPLTCVRNEVTLRTAAALPPPSYRYEWFNDRDSLLGAGPSQVVAAEETFSLVTQDIDNGCRDTTFATVGADRTPPVVELVDPLVLNCFRGIATIDGRNSSQGANFEHAWASPAGSAIPSDDPYRIRGTLPGTYALTVRNRRNGCITTDSVEVLQDAVQIEGFSFDVDQPACIQDRDGKVTITEVRGGTAPFTFQLDGGLVTTRREYENLPVGLYELEVFGDDGCSVAETFEVRRAEEPILILREDTTIRLGDTLRLDFATNFPDWDTLIWTSSGPLPALRSDGPISVSPLRSQSYRLQILDEEGCTATDFMIVTVDGEVNVYVPSAFSPNGDGTNDLMRPYPGAQVERIEKFRIYNRWGELLYDLAADPGLGTEVFGWDGRLDGKLLNPQVLVYEMEVLLIDNDRFEQTGDFILMR